MATYYRQLLTALETIEIMVNVLNLFDVMYPWKKPKDSP